MNSATCSPLKFEVEVAAFGDDAPLVVGFAAAPLPAARRGGGGPLQRCPVGLGPRFGARAQCRVVVHAEHQVDPLGPAVEVRCQREVGLPAQAHPLGVRGDQLDRLVVIAPALFVLAVGGMVPSTSR